MRPYILEDVFDISYDAIIKAVRSRGVEPTACKWVDFLLHCRKVQTFLDHETLNVDATRTAHGERVFFHPYRVPWKKI